MPKQELQFDSKTIISVFSPYIGQDVLVPEGYQFQGYRTDAKLLPFNGIKDEYIHFEGIYAFYPAGDFKLVLKSLAEIHPKDAHYIAMLSGCSLIGKAEDMGMEIAKRILTERHLAPISTSVYQYLQKEGYDLPQLLLDNKMLHEVGLAVYKHEL